MNIAYHRAKKIYSLKEKSKCRMDRVKFMSWNGYPAYTRNSIIKRLTSNTNTNRNKGTNNVKKIIWVRLPYLQHVREEMKKCCFLKIQKCMTEKAYFFTRYETKTLAMFYSVKDLYSHSKSQMLFIA